MSIYDVVTLEAENSSKTSHIAKSLACSLYTRPLTILLMGELGAGKTTFAQGLAQELGIADPIQSPTFALENRHGEVLSHIDLYRLSEAEARHFLHSNEHFPGIRLIEWPERVPLDSFDGPLIIVNIDEKDAITRMVTIDCRDIAIPSKEERSAWIDEVRLPVHIQKHMQAVTAVAMTCADVLISQGTFIRREALRAAAETHDLMRFVDFKLEAMAGHETTEAQRKHWQPYKEKYAPWHELAAKQFVAEKGYPAIAEIISSHGPVIADRPQPTTIEQKVLAYSDKRVKFDTVVSLDERFDDFIQRYSKGVESEFNKKWRVEMKELERELFGGKPPL